eukprot:m.249673 g.249673  ORF g.249673 m.249673 type:complete len:439 (-) comp16253_c0_seq1:96-1412(-)
MEPTLPARKRPRLREWRAGLAEATAREALYLASDACRDATALLEGNVTAIAINATGVLLAVALRSCSIHLVSIPLSKIIASAPQSTRSIWCLDFHPTDQHTFATGSLDGVVRVWRCANSELVAIAEHAYVHRVRALVFHPTLNFLSITTDTTYAWHGYDHSPAPHVPATWWASLAARAGSASSQPADEIATPIQFVASRGRHYILTRTTCAGSELAVHLWLAPLSTREAGAIDLDTCTLLYSCKTSLDTTARLSPDGSMLLFSTSTSISLFRIAASQPALIAASPSPPPDEVFVTPSRDITDCATPVNTLRELQTPVSPYAPPKPRPRRFSSAWLPSEPITHDAAHDSTVSVTPIGRRLYLGEDVTATFSSTGDHVIVARASPDKITVDICPASNLAADVRAASWPCDTQAVMAAVVADTVRGGALFVASTSGVYSLR